MGSGASINENSNEEHIAKEIAKLGKSYKMIAADVHKSGIKGKDIRGRIDANKLVDRIKIKHPIQRLRLITEINHIREAAEQAPIKDHFFISYHPTKDVLLANLLYMGIRELSLVKTFPVENEGDKVSVFLDIQRHGEDYIEALKHSMVFVPIISWVAGTDQTASGTVADLVNLSENHPNIPLLQWEIALALQDSYKFPLQSIFPILNGGTLGNNKVFKDLFADARFDLIPKTVHVATKEKLIELCGKHGIPLSPKALKRTVKDVLDDITKNQGCKLCDVGGTETMSVNKCIEIVFDTGASLLENEDDDEDDDEREEGKNDDEGQ